MVTQPVPAFARFIDDLRAIWARLPDDEARMNAARPLLAGLLDDAALRAHSERWPSTEGRRNLLFYEDPDFGFAINGVVREPNRRGGVHDHNHAWVLYGLLVGTETLERFDRLDDGSRPGRAELRLAGAKAGKPGDVDLVEPFAIHAEQGGPGRSVAVILRSARVAGRVPQGRYDPATGAHSEGEGPEQIPYELTV